MLIGGKESEAPPGVSAGEWKRLGEEKRQQKLGFADLSRNSKVIVDPKSGHHIQLDNPGLVIDSIREVIEAARRRGKLKARVSDTKEGSTVSDAKARRGGTPP